MEDDPFVVQVRAFVEKAGRLAQAAFRATAQDSVDRVKELTPVDTGNLRANWTTMRGDQVEPVAGRVPPPEEAVMRLRIGDKLIVLNPVVYARRVEFGFVGEDSRGRYFSQAGRGMVQQTVVEVPAIAERATLRIIEGGSGS